MYIEVLYRVRAEPFAHLGRPSLSRLDSFHSGYALFPKVTVAQDYMFSALREWVLARYRPLGAETKDAVQVLLDVSRDDRRAFDLFFAALDAALAGRADQLVPRESPLSEGEPLAASGFLDVLGERPSMFLRRTTVGCLRAFLDGYSLVAVEEGFRTCGDLEGFEHWVRERLSLRGLFRWEEAVVTRFAGDEQKAFVWVLRELKAYRASTGPESGRRYKVINVGKHGNSESESG